MNRSINRNAITVKLDQASKVKLQRKLQFTNLSIDTIINNLIIKEL